MILLVFAIIIEQTDKFAHELSGRTTRDGHTLNLWKEMHINKFGSAIGSVISLSPCALKYVCKL